VVVVNVRSWFDLARKVLNLTMQLNAKTQELCDAHRRIRVLEQERTDALDQLDALRRKYEGNPS